MVLELDYLSLVYYGCQCVRPIYLSLETSSVRTRLFWTGSPTGTKRNRYDLRVPFFTKVLHVVDFRTLQVSVLILLLIFVCRRRNGVELVSFHLYQIYSMSLGVFFL